MIVVMSILSDYLRSIRITWKAFSIKLLMVRGKSRLFDFRVVGDFVGVSVSFCENIINT